VIRLILLAVLATSLAAEGWQVDLPCVPGAEARIALASSALAQARALAVSWRRDGASGSDDSWLELDLITADERWFATAAALMVPGGDHLERIEVPLSASAWSGRDGRLGGDALGAVRELRLRVHGGRGGGRLTATLTALALIDEPAFVVEMAASGLVTRTLNVDSAPLWRELRLRLVGDTRGERGTLDLIDAGGRHWPLFLEQPASVVAGAWRAQGAARWVLRLGMDELPTWPARLAWNDRDSTWISPPLTLPLAQVGREPLAAAPACALAMPSAPAWNGHPAVPDGERFLRGPASALPTALAPVIAWQAGWTGFRGPDAVAHPQALAFDRCLVDVIEIDLLPQALAEEHGAFRFGLAPWAKSQGGAWEYPQDLLADDAAWPSWRWHAREVLARARAAPGLRRWRLGLEQPANRAADVARMRGLAGDLAALVSRYDRRPLLALHAHLVEHRYQKDPAGVWCGFEQGLQGWSTGPGPLAARPATVEPDGSEGTRSLAVPLIDLGGVRVGGVLRLVDGNVANLDRLEVDLRATGPASAAVQWYAWCTDQHHRWYQQPIGRAPCSPRWSTLGVDFGVDAAWQPVGHAQPWDGDQRRHLRRLGLIAFVHGDPAGIGRVAIDRIRRLGWPDEAVPTLAITDLVVAAPPTTTGVPIAADFALTVPARNPYDPEQADVAAEIVDPDGRTLRYPAYWSEPFALRMDGGSEQAVPTGAGAWHLRFSPPRGGSWRWRLVARVRWRDQTLRVEGEWRTVQVPDALPALAPLRVSTRDPRWWERTDGSWFYPLGINLRSPSDTRQQPVVAAAIAARGAPAVGGLGSADPGPLGTRAYEHWFARMRAARMNWARVWMSPWWCGLEWNKAWDEFGGLTVYNQAAAARLDRVMELAGANGIYVQLELQNHGMTSRNVDAQWDADGRGGVGSPYNRLNGGPCAAPGEFFSREDVWAIHAKRLRYTLARWGHLSHLAAFVLTSEMEFTGDWNESGAFADEAGHSDVTQRWVERSLAWFAANDPQRRSVSIHFSQPWRGAKLWRMPGLAFSNSNAYTGFQDAHQQLGGPGAGLGVALERYIDHFPPWELQRPTLLGEWGGHWERNSPDRLAGELHCGLWQQAVLPYGANVGFWWWLWVDAVDAWGQYRTIAAFVDGDDPRGRDWRPTKPALTNRDVSITGMGCADAYRLYAWAPGLQRKPVVPAVIDAGTVTLATGQPGRVWSWERWDCGKGMVSERGRVVADNDGHVRIELGRLAPDAAFKLRRE